MVSGIGLALGFSLGRCTSGDGSGCRDVLGVGGIPVAGRDGVGFGGALVFGGYAVVYFVVCSVVYLVVCDVLCVVCVVRRVVMRVVVLVVVGGYVGGYVGGVQQSVLIIVNEPSSMTTCFS